MKCQACGTSLPDAAVACWKCGKPVRSNVQEEKWEICTIEVESKSSLFSDAIRYVAKAIGETGIYIAGSTQWFNSSNLKQAHKEVEALVAYLVKDNWEPTGKYAESFFGYKFRRPIK